MADNPQQTLLDHVVEGQGITEALTGDLGAQLEQVAQDNILGGALDAVTQGNGPLGDLWAGLGQLLARFRG